MTVLVHKYPSERMATKPEYVAVRFADIFYQFHRQFGCIQSYSPCLLTSLEADYHTRVPEHHTTKVRQLINTFVDKAIVTTKRPPVDTSKRSPMH